MADFRKLFLVLVVAALFVATASAADYACTATAVPTLVRAEALADYVGDVLLTCDGTVPVGGITANIRMTLGANITSNPLSEQSLSEATLILDNGVGGFRGYDDVDPVLVPNPNGLQNVYQAARITNTEIEWQGVVLAAAGTVHKTIRLTNVRANAQGLGSGAPIAAVINITSPTSVPITNNSLVVANIRQGLLFSVDEGVFKACESPSKSITLTYEEGFGTAFKPKLNNLGTAVPHNVPGGGFQDESGFNPGTLTAGDLVDLSKIGAATQGTRLVSRIIGVPAGVTLTAPLTLTDDQGLQLVLITGFSSSFAGGEEATDGEIALDASGNGAIVYEVTGYASGATAPSFTDTVEVEIEVDFDVPGTAGVAMVTGSFGPISTTGTASSSAPEPRFVESTNEKDFLAINLCRTILLFPDITNQAGFDTGIAISNTSVDPLDTEGQQGPCKLYYFGNTNGGAAPASQTTPVVPAGGQLLMLLSTGGSILANGGGTATACASGSCLAPGFQGYMIAVCSFQYAHGFAFITDMGASKLAMGYLALVIPDTSGGTRPPDPFSAAGAGTGEQLVQ